MTSVSLDVTGLEPFDPKGEILNLSQRWKKWKRAFSLYVTGKGVSNDAQKRAFCCMSLVWVCKKFIPQVSYDHRSYYLRNCV